MAPTKIYITSLAKAQPGKRPLTALAMPVVDSKPAIVLEAPSPPRKRQRLTHLTPEEKLMRRKLKNRVAAQTARDRKKAHMDSMEDRLTKLEEYTKRLQLENRAVKEQNAVLVAENSELKRRLGLEQIEGQATQMTKVGTVTTVKKESKSPESAALNAPPQQGQSDVLLGLLDGLQDQISAKSQCENGTNQPTDDACRIQIGKKINTTLVGPTAEELESLKELIKFDHEYVKKPSELAKHTLNVITTCNNLATELTNTKHQVKGDTDDVLLTPEIQTVDTADLVPNLLDSTEGTFDCDISDLLSFDLGNCDAKSESGLSDSSGGDSAFGDMPKSPFSDDAAMSPGLGNGSWEESFTELFPSLEDLC